MIEKNERKLNESQASVQTHLGILQRVIDRMASNSSASKAWCITLVSALLVVVADKKKPDFAFIALIPTVLFGVLDAYYLAKEKGFIAAYSYFVQRTHEGKLTSDDLYSVAPRGKISDLLGNAFMSFSIWGFYIGMGSMIVLARIFILE